MFQHSSSPQALSGRRGKKALYRDDDEGHRLRQDPRVTATSAAAARNRRTNWLREAKPSTDEGIRDLLRQALRQPVDISANLVEAGEGSLTTNTIECQTAEFLPKPRSPRYVPHKTGIDRATQIDEDGPGLFDFDVEVAPLLDVIVCKTLDQALLEVNRESELAGLRKSKEAFLENNAALLQERQAHEEEHMKHLVAKAERIRREQERLALELKLAEKVAACQVFQTEAGFWLEENSFQALAESGVFPDVVHEAIIGEFLPWLEERVCKRVATRQVGRKVLDELVAFALETRRRRGKAHYREIRERKAREAAEERARLQREAEEKALAEAIARARQRVEIYLQGPEVVGDEPLGPICVSIKDTLVEADKQISAWLQDRGHDIARPEHGFLQLVPGMLSDDEISKLEDAEMTLGELTYFQERHEDGEQGGPNAV
mmetsp:Transcript_17896/g.45439  ORF Transcript_17896/g.45439 Transcript_17896/m.45439 type:complete len:433 (-) Transcript_17896:238-1536(-)